MTGEKSTQAKCPQQWPLCHLHSTLKSWKMKEQPCGLSFRSVSCTPEQVATLHYILFRLSRIMLDSFLEAVALTLATGCCARPAPSLLSAWPWFFCTRQQAWCSEVLHGSNIIQLTAVAVKCSDKAEQMLKCCFWTCMHGFPQGGLAGQNCYWFSDIVLTGETLL